MRVALGVSGGIAAYKAAELVRRLQDRGLEVEVIMTRNACEFVTPLTFAALSGRKVITTQFGEAASRGASGTANFESAIEHIAVAQRISALVIAPATADVIARMAHGLADDFLTTLVLATPAPVIVAPAMNVNMWEQAATRENIATLRRRGCRVLEPDEGYLACGMTGAGRLASVEAIAAAVCGLLGLDEDLKGETILVTAGPTEESLDAVRYLGNRSSGKMGYAVAEAGLRRGARVVLVSGPVDLDPPAGAETEKVRTAEEMAGAVFKHLGSASVVVMAAAVADFRASRPAPKKIKRAGTASRILKLVPTRDILAEVSRRRQDGQIIVGFAAETDHVLENAGAKLRRKRLDLVVVNDVTAEGAGFDADTNVVTLLFPDGRVKPIEKMSKRDVAGRVLDEVVSMRKLGAGLPGR